MLDAVIIDPTKVTRTGMVDAASAMGWLGYGWRSELFNRAQNRSFKAGEFGLFET